MLIFVTYPQLKPLHGLSANFQDMFNTRGARNDKVSERIWQEPKTYSNFHLWAGVRACGSWLILSLWDRGGGGLRSLSALLVSNVYCACLE